MKIIDTGLKFPQARTKRTRTDGIVVHHLDAQWNVQRTHEAHIAKGWNGIGYNYHVAKDGAISIGRGQEFVGSHTNPPVGTNSSMIGIACEGQYHSVDKQMPNAQYNALVWLIRYLREIYGNIPIYGHRDLAATACPGQFFPLDEVKKLEYREEEEEMQRFNTINEIPEYGKFSVQKRIDRGVFGDANALNLTEDMVRQFVFDDRNGKAIGLLDDDLELK